MPVEVLTVDNPCDGIALYLRMKAEGHPHADRALELLTLNGGNSSGEGIAPDTVRMRLQPGCTAIIASDGVLADADDSWLKAMLESDTDDMKALARAVLKQAEKLYGAGDDMTVLTIRVEERA